MIINKAFKFQLVPTDEQISTIKQHGGNVRFIWNKLLEFANDIKKNTKKYPTQSELQKQVIVIKSENDFMKISHSQPLQINAKRLSETFFKAFKPKTIEQRNQKIAKAHQIKDPIEKAKKLKKAFEFGFPKFKCKNRCNDSIFYPQFFKIEENKITFPKLGTVKFIKHREIIGTPKSLTITQDGNRYFVSIQCETEMQEKQKVDIEHANIVGIDVGMSTFATLSDGTEIKSPKNLRKYLKKLKKEQRKVSRKQLIETEEIKFGKKVKVSSNNREKQCDKVVKLHKKVKNVRKDFLHKTSRYIINKYDGIIMEDLDIENMLKAKRSKSFRRSLYDVSLYAFVSFMEYKAEWENKYFILIDRYYPSTQRCNCCGNISHLGLNDRVYHCPNCGSKLGRDYNASLNIRDEGIRILKNTLATKGISKGKNKILPLENACGENVMNIFEETRKVVIEEKSKRSEKIQKVLL